MNSKYKSGKSVAKNATVPISADDPRVAWNKVSQTKSRQGSEIDIVGFDGKLLVAGGTNSSNITGVTGSPSPVGIKEQQYVPPSNGIPGYKSGYGAVTPTAVSSVTASWSGDDLVIGFNWDYLDSLNSTISEFIVELTADGVTKQTPLQSFLVNRTQTAQTLTVTKALNESMFGIQRTVFTAICVLSIDPFYNKSSTACVSSIPTYILDLPTPTITVTAINAGYSVAYTTPTEARYNSIEVVEYESASATAPTGVTYLRSYFGVVNPANIITFNFNARWVKARFYSDAGLTTPFSTAYKVTPTNPVVADTTGPADVATVTTTGGLDTTGTIGFNGFADISWASVTTGGIRGYRIRYRPVTSPVSSYSYADSPGVGTSYRLSGLGAGLTYEIAVATYDEYNNTSTSYVAGSNVAISGTPFIGTNVSTTGFFQAGVSGTDTGTFKFGYGVDTGKRGLVFNAHNYWYIDSAQSASLKVGGSTTNYIQWNGSTFAIDGDITARSGYFAGNVGIISGGSLYSGTISAGSIVGAGYILNSSGLTFNSSSVSGITTIDASNGKLTTASANIGGWDVSASSISKTAISGKGNIEIDSTNGYIAVSNSSISTYKAGINSPGNDVTHSVFWAGNGTGPNDTANKFRVTVAGKVFATDAEITGKISAGSGYIGSFSNGWTISSERIVATGTGSIQVGNFKIQSQSTTDFAIVDVTDTQSPSVIIRTETKAGATDSPKRIFLGDTTRQIEVAKSAQISGNGTVLADGFNTAATNAYRSGGLRNMFTVSSGNLVNTIYPSALVGDVLLVYSATQGI